jgi:hypothetical protein
VVQIQTPNLFPDVAHDVAQSPRRVFKLG